MKVFKKIIITSFIFGFILNTSLAENDCEIFWKLKYNQEGKSTNWFEIVNDYREKETEYTKWFLTVDQQREIIDNNSLNTAILNLKKYCCDNELWGLTQDIDTCKIDEKFFNPNTIDSPYLFDHIFDVIMRRLSWLTWENDIYTKTNMTGDSKWLERRQRIDEQAENISWANPQVIINKYSNFWKESPLKLGYNINNDIHKAFLEHNSNTFLTYAKWNWWSPESKKIANALQNYKERSLRDRYDNACALSEFFYAFLSKAWESSDRNEILKFKNDCNQITSDQVSSEVRYISLVIKKSSNLFLSNYLKWYISYLDKRANNLKSIWKNTTDRFFDTARAVPMLLDKCTKW